jgi:hypothetical protein
MENSSGAVVAIDVHSTIPYSDEPFYEKVTKRVTGTWQLGLLK